MVGSPNGRAGTIGGLHVTLLTYLRSLLRPWTRGGLPLRLRLPKSLLLGVRIPLRPLLNRSLLGRSLLNRSLLNRSLLNRSLLNRSLLGPSLLGRTLLGRTLLRLILVSQPSAVVIDTGYLGQRNRARRPGNQDASQGQNNNAAVASHWELTPNPCKLIAREHGNRTFPSIRGLGYLRSMGGVIRNARIIGIIRTIQKIGTTVTSSPAGSDNSAGFHRKNVESGP